MKSSVKIFEWSFLADRKSSKCVKVFFFNNLEKLAVAANALIDIAGSNNFSRHC